MYLFYNYAILLNRWQAAEQAEQTAEMLRQLDEPLFQVIAVDSSPSTPPPPPPKLHRCGGRNVKSSELSPGGWSLRHAETKCLGDTQVDSPRPDHGLATDESKPMERALPAPPPKNFVDGTTPESSLGLPSHEPEPSQSPMPPSHEPEPSQSPVPPSHEPEPSQSTAPPSQPEPANTVNTQDCYFYYLPLLYTCYRIELDGLGFLLSLYNIDSSLFLSLVTSLSQDLRPSLIAGSGGNLVSTGELVPFSSGVAPAAKPGKGKGGTLPDGKGKGTGAGPPSGHHEHAPNMVWAQGPDEAPMLAVEMEFDDEGSSAPEPPKELPDISEGAVYKRMWRLFRPRADGSYLVPECVVHEYQNKETRPGVVRAFERCGYDVVPSLCYFAYNIYLLKPWHPRQSSSRRSRRPWKMRRRWRLTKIGSS